METTNNLSPEELEGEISFTELLLAQARQMQRSNKPGERIAAARAEIQFQKKLAELLKQQGRKRSGG